MNLRRTLRLLGSVLLAIVVTGWAARPSRTDASAASDTYGQQQAAPAASPQRDYPVQPVPFTAVHLDDGFWAPRIETNRTATIPTAFKQCELSGRVDNF